MRFFSVVRISLNFGQLVVSVWFQAVLATPIATEMYKLVDTVNLIAGNMVNYRVDTVLYGCIKV